jgi:predicted SpoU family rRNA methylase
MSPLANYTTSVPAIKSVGEIQGILVAHGAKSILINYADNGVVESLSFIVKTPYGDMPIRLPTDAKAVLRVMEEQRLPRRYLTYEQAVKVAWRIVKDWVRAQMAILETEMVKMEQIFLPYMAVSDDKTLYDAMVDKKFYLGPGEKD